MTIEEKEYYLSDYCDSMDSCKECIFYRENDDCKYGFLDKEECEKAYAELKEYENMKMNVGSDGLMTTEEKRSELQAYCDGTLCSECMFKFKSDSRRFDCKYDFDDDKECEMAYSELMMKYGENQCESKGDTTYWEVDGGILSADESMTKLIEFIIEKKLSYSDFHKTSLVNL